MSKKSQQRWFFGGLVGLLLLGFSCVPPASPYKRMCERDQDCDWATPHFRCLSLPDATKRCLDPMGCDAAQIGQPCRLQQDGQVCGSSTGVTLCQQGQLRCEQLATQPCPHLFASAKDLDCRTDLDCPSSNANERFRCIKNEATAKQVCMSVQGCDNDPKRDQIGTACFRVHGSKGKDCTTGRLVYQCIKGQVICQAQIFCPGLPGRPFIDSDCDGRLDCERTIQSKGQTFTMGSQKAFLTPSQQPQNDELPERKVSFNYNFTMWQFEITQQEFMVLLGERDGRTEIIEETTKGKVKLPLQTNPSYFTKCQESCHPTVWEPNCEHRCPVGRVNTYQAMLFANQLTLRLEGSRPQGKTCYDCFLTPKGKTPFQCQPKPEWTGSNYIKCKGFRLPTEAEWEFAARGGAMMPNDTRHSHRAGVRIEEDKQSCSDLRLLGYLALGRFCQSLPVSCQFNDPVARKGCLGPGPVGENGAWSSTPAGVFDLFGNVWEWTIDYHAPSYEGLTPNDPTGRKEPYAKPDGGFPTAEDQARTIRGGGWFTEPFAIRATNRTRSSSNKGIVDNLPSAKENKAQRPIGFRVVRTIP